MSQLAYKAIRGQQRLKGKGQACKGGVGQWHARAERGMGIVKGV